MRCGLAALGVGLFAGCSAPRTSAVRPELAPLRAQVAPSRTEPSQRPPSSPASSRAAHAIRAAAPDASTSGSTFRAFSPTGRYVVGDSGHGVATIVELPMLRVVARFSSSHLAQAELSMPSDTRVVLTEQVDDQRLEEVHNAQTGALLSQVRSAWEPAPAVIETAFGSVQIDVQHDADGYPVRSRLLLTQKDGKKKSFDLRSSFGDRHTKLESLGVFGESLLLRSEAFEGGPFGRVGSVNLRNGHVNRVREVLTASGNVATFGNRMLFSQNGDGSAWLFALPSLARLVTYTYPGARQVSLHELPMGEPAACVAVSPDTNTLALLGSHMLRWFDTQSGRMLGEQSIDAAGDFFSCTLGFTSDGSSLVHSTRYGAVNVLDVRRGKVVLSREFAFCVECDGAAGNVGWKSQSVLSPDLRFFAAASTVTQPRETQPNFGVLLDLTHGTVTHLGVASSAAFDPTSRYLAVDRRVYETSPFRLLGALP